MPAHLSIPMDTIVPGILTETSQRASGGHDTRKQNDSPNQERCSMLDKTPTPIYRHAAPSGPWPWMDFDEDVPAVEPTDHLGSDTHSWQRYPQNLFPNWTENQVRRCEMLTACPDGESTVLKVDVLHDGTFGHYGQNLATITDKQSEIEFWDMLYRPREEGIRVRALFVKNMTQDVLQMLGTKYTIEPFFFSSSINWIPSRYQENLVAKQSDHITVVLPFIRVMNVGQIPLHPRTKEPGSSPSLQEDDQIIDTHSPLYLNSCDKYILQDLLSVHMARAVQSSTIISYHPKTRRSTAEQLHTLINRTGRSVYWSKIFEKSKDPTCLFLCFLWYAMYQWDEVFEILYTHVSKLEQSVLDSENIRKTRDLHILSAHLLYYRSLLEDFRKTVVFVQETTNPAMRDPSVTNQERALSESILKKETDYLISEIERLESQRMMQVMRLKNVMDLAFATVNIDDSKYMQKLTIATVRDSAAMKQLSYLTMVFLPANFMSNVFSMNVVEINPNSGRETIPRFIIGAIGLTLFAVWVVIALQVDSRFFPRGSAVWRRAGWPLFYVWELWLRMYHRALVGKRKTTRT